MRVCCISDLHGHLPELPDADLTVIGGDLCPYFHWVARPFEQARWLQNHFIPWTEAIKSPVCFVAGNHDYVFQTTPHLVPRFSKQIHYLEDRMVEINGFKIYGTPWQLYFCDMAFNLDDTALGRKWELIPDDADVILLHQPPYEYGDLTASGTYVGCKQLTKRIKQVRPKLVVCGHVHGSRGIYHLGHTDESMTTIVNASLVDDRYQLVNEPFVVNLEKHRQQEQ